MLMNSSVNPAASRSVLGWNARQLTGPILWVDPLNTSWYGRSTQIWSPFWTLPVKSAAPPGSNSLTYTKANNRSVPHSIPVLLDIHTRYNAGFSFRSIPFGVLLAASSLSVQSSAPSLLDDLLDILRSLTSLKWYETLWRGTVTSSPCLFSRLTEGIGTPYLTTEGNKTDELVPGPPKEKECIIVIIVHLFKKRSATG